MVKLQFDYRKLYTYRFMRWIWQLMTKQKLLITYTIDPKTMRFEENLTIAKISTAQAYGMGYVRGKKIKDEAKYIFFKTYVRFTPDNKPPFPVLIMGDDGVVRENWETSSTLYDHWKSDAGKSFIKGMTKATLTGGDQKKLLMIVGICVVAAIGLYFVLFQVVPS